MSKDLLTVKDLKERYSCSNDKVMSLLIRSDFPSFKLDDKPKARWYVRKDDLDNWERQRCKIKYL